MLQDYTKFFRFCTLLLLLPALAVAAPQKTLPKVKAKTLAQAPAKNNNMFVEGQDYIKLPDTVRENPNVQQLLMTDPHKVQVLFFFSYGCHGCEMFHTPFEKWATQQRKAANNKAAIYIYPVAFNAQWAVLARLYYVMETLDPDGKMNNAIFTAIHKNGIKLWDPEVMKKFFVQNGYSAARFDLAYNSFTVNRQVKRADDLSKAYGIVATPDIIINGPVNSYKLDLSKAGNNMPRLIDIINYLVVRESKLL